MPYECANADGNLAAVILTNLETGDTLPACPDCMPTILLGVVEAATGQTFAPVGEAVPDLDTDTDEDDTEAAPEAPLTPPGADPTPEVAPGGPDEADPEPEAPASGSEFDIEAAYPSVAAELGHRVSG